MASEKSSAAKTTSPPSPALMSDKQRRLYTLGMVLALTAFAIGGFGLLILLDQEEKKHWYTHTEFANLWRWLTEKNPMVTAMLVNGGGIYSFILFARLREDIKARKALKTQGKKTL